MVDHRVCNSKPAGATSNPSTMSNSVGHAELVGKRRGLQPIHTSGIVANVRGIT